MEVLQTSALDHLATSPLHPVQPSRGLQAIVQRVSRIQLWCRGRDSNPHALTSTAPSTLLVYQFQHLGSGTRPVKRVAGAEGLEPPAFGFGDRRSSQLSYAPMSPAHQRPFM